MNFLIDFLGCKVNSYETQAISEIMTNAGYFKYDPKNDKKCDIIIINTCAVTETATSKDRKLIRKYRRKFKNSIIIVMGCYSQYAYDLISNELDCEIVLGTSKRDEISNYINEYLKTKKKLVIHDDNNSIKKYENIGLSYPIEQTRAYIKIQDGCDNYCTYCLIPYIRGRSRSRDKDSILNEIKSVISKGIKEIVLTGIDIGSYGEDKTDNYKFSDLLEDILKSNSELYRLRISSIEESQIDDKFLNLLKEYPNIANHLHIPLQSGSVNILKKMNRKYNLDNYKDIIKKIRDIRPDIAITTDVIIGFPGEAEEDFEETYNFCNEIKFSKIHVFPYSKRKGTIAASLLNQVDEYDKKIRKTKLLNLSLQLEQEYEKQFYGKEIEFLFESKIKKSDYYAGHSSNYLEIAYKSKNNIENKIMKVTFKKDNSMLFFDYVKSLFR